MKKELKVMLILLGLLSLFMIITLVSLTAATTRIECENMTLGGQYAAKISSPFSGVALYANNDYCATNFNFTVSTNTISVRGACNNSSNARVDVKVGGTTVGSLYFSGTTAAVRSLSNINTGTGSKEVRLTVTTDTGSWDALVDYVEISNNSTLPTPTPTRGGSNPTPTQGGTGGTKYITSTIVVAAGQTYDGGNQTIICQGMGDGSQAENQKPVFKLENGATLKNVIIGFPGCDGVHCYGNNTVSNVRWTDIGEDALTVKGSETVSAGTITIDGGYANYGDDKVIQVNAPCTLRVSNFSADGMGKFCRQNGGTTFTMTLYLTNVTCKNVKEAIYRTDSSTSQVYYRNLTVTNFQGSNGWWYGRNSQAHTY